jgi:hypothetical protein
VQVTDQGLPLPVTSWQAPYASQDSKDNSTADVAAITVAAGGLHERPRPLVCLQAAEDSVGSDRIT